MAKSLGQLVWKFATEVKDHVKNGMKNVDVITYKKRMESCLKCAHYKETGQCDLCGCFMEVKTKWASSFCPKNPQEWGRENEG